MPAKRKNPDQSKSALAAKFNKRIQALISEGFNAETLPEMITNPEAFTHRELRQLVSAATEKKSAGVYQFGGEMLSEIRHSYTEAITNIINVRREKARAKVAKANVTVAGEKFGMKRAEMMDARSQLYQPIQTTHKFAYAKQETDYIKRLTRKAETNYDKMFVQNLLSAVIKRFGNHPDLPTLTATIIKNSVSKVMKAYASEELFDITPIYMSTGNDDEYLQILIKALKQAGCTIYEGTPETNNKVNDILQNKAASENVALTNRIYG